jgi:hypothetical protein
MTSIDINNIVSTISDLQNKQRILEQNSNEYKQQLIVQKKRFDDETSKFNKIHTSLKEENNLLKRKLDEQLSYNKRIKTDDFKDIHDNNYYTKYIKNNEKIFSWFVSIDYLFNIINIDISTYNDLRKLFFNYKDLSYKIRNYFYNQYGIPDEICNNIASSINYHFKRDLYKHEQLLQIETTYTNPNIYDNISKIMIEISKNDQTHKQFHPTIPIITTNPYKYLVNPPK